MECIIFRKIAPKQGENGQSHVRTSTLNLYFMNTNTAHLIRLATPQDLPRLNALIWTSKMHWGYPTSWMEGWKEDLTLTEEHLKHERVYLLSQEQEIFGCCSVAQKNKFWEVMHLWIAPGHMGKGWGKRLLNEVMEREIPKDRPVRVVADPHARGFYERQGFQVMGWVSSKPEGRELPLMEKPPGSASESRIHGNAT